jgi:hypothetical protein
MPTEFRRIEFIGGPLDGAIRPVPADCLSVPLAYGAVVHLYTRDEVYTGFSVREVMRHAGAIHTGHNQHGRTG